jgi:hypothetical protein
MTRRLRGGVGRRTGTITVARPRSNPDTPAAKRERPPSEPAAAGQRLCGAARFEMVVPARWAWHDHSEASRRAHGAACATYVGSWRSRLRVIQGDDEITRYEAPKTGMTRSFCRRCGVPLFYERAHSPQMVNIPRALFEGRTGREPRYHIAIDQTPDWAYLGEPVAPLKGFPGVVWERPRRKKHRAPLDLI